jgi:DNA repair protein RadC
MGNAAEKLTIKSWAEDDRPREKLLSKGRTALSDAELIAILIGSGNKDESAVELSKRILASIQNNLNELAKLSIQDLMKFKGIGEAKAISIAAALELGRRRKEQNNTGKVRITTSKGAFDVFYPLVADLPHEEFWVLLLSRSNEIISKNRISSGGVSGTVADTRLIFKQAIEMLATSVIFCHNHPSGNTNPSDADIKLTNRLKQAGEIMEIKVIDHIIIGGKDYFSFADEGIL